jgi:FAD/FMN-containing dehydrogenase
MYRMSGVEVDAEHQTAGIECGVRWGKVVREAAKLVWRR